MRNMGSVLAVLGLFFMIAVGCGSSDDASAGSDDGGGTGTVEQVEIGMTEQEVIELLGENSGTGENGATGENALIFLDDDYKSTFIWFKDGKVTKIGTS